jgi:hypothetical protein
MNSPRQEETDKHFQFHTQVKEYVAKLDNTKTQKTKLGQIAQLAPAPRGLLVKPRKMDVSNCRIFVQ